MDLTLWLAILGTLVIALPLILMTSLGIPSLVGRKLSESQTVRAVQCTTVAGLTSSLAVLILMLLTDRRHVVADFGNWIHLENPAPEPEYHFAIKFVFDRLSIPFLILIYLLVGTIGAFAARYMHRESGFNRFFVLYSIFLTGMVTTALAATIETLFLGWELVGLSSALLIGFFHERPAPVRNAFRVWVIYRISDAALLLAAISLHHLGGAGDFDKLMGYREIAGVAPADQDSWPFGNSGITPTSALFVGILMLIAAAGKSALIPFSGWLPRAMEGPTPSSAVFYGALSVHLGAYLLLRLDPLLDASPLLSGFVVAIGLVTAVLSALIGRVQTDIKSALSFAALTQVGLIVAEIGLGFRYLPLVHMIGHACLRTLQFLRAPSYIRDHHAIENAVGNRIPRPSGGRLGAMNEWLYRFAIERGYLDGILNRVIVGPFQTIFRWLDYLDQQATAWMSREARPQIRKQQQERPTELEV